MTRSRGGSFTMQPRIEAFTGQPTPPPGRRKSNRPDLLERHAPNPLEPTHCIHCGFAWLGHPADIRSAGVAVSP